MMTRMITMMMLALVLATDAGLRADRVCRAKPVNDPGRRLGRVDIGPQVVRDQPFAGRDLVGARTAQRANLRTRTTAQATHNYPI